MQELACNTNSDQLHRVADFVRQNAVVGMPLPDNGVGILRDASERTIAVVPVRLLDEWRIARDDYAYLYASTGRRGPWASYARPTRAIYCGGEWTADHRWPAIALLHEGQHAYEHLVEGKALTDPVWQREARARRLEYQALLGLGGSRLDQLLHRLRPQVARTRPLARFRLSPAEDRDADRIFGSPVSHVDRQWRNTLVENAAVHHWASTATPSERRRLRHFFTPHGWRAGAA